MARPVLQNKSVCVDHRWDEFYCGRRTWAHSLASQKWHTYGSSNLPTQNGFTLLVEVNKGAFLNGDKIFVSQNRELKDAEILKKSIFEENIWKSGNSALLGNGIVHLAYRLALVAEGRFDAMITLGRSWEWDICAGHLLVSEAGGSVTTSFGGEIVYNSNAGSSKGIIAGNPTIHKSVTNELNI